MENKTIRHFGKNTLNEFLEELKERVVNKLHELEKALPKKLSDLENDLEIATTRYVDAASASIRSSIATSLVNYYLKSETYTQEEVNSLVSSIPKFAIEVVDTLPTEDISTTTVYLMTTEADANNLYTEYIYVNGSWEKLGEQKLVDDAGSQKSQVQIITWEADD